MSSYVQLIVRVQERNTIPFYSIYNQLINKYQLKDAYFLLRRQRVFVSSLSPGFFSEIENWVGLQQKIIVFFFISGYKSEARFIYDKYSPYNINKDIYYIPFNWYTRRLIYWDSAGLSQGQNGAYYNIFSCGFTPIAWVRERGNKVTSGGSTLVLRNTSNYEIFIKREANNIAIPTGYYSVLYPLNFSRLLFKFIDKPTTSAQVHYEATLSDAYYAVESTKNFEGKIFDNELDFEVTVFNQKDFSRLVHLSQVDYIQSAQDAFVGCEITCYPIDVSPPNPILFNEWFFPKEPPGAFYAPVQQSSLFALLFTTPVDTGLERRHFFAQINSSYNFVNATGSYALNKKAIYFGSTTEIKVVELDTSQVDLTYVSNQNVFVTTLSWYDLGSAILRPWGQHSPTEIVFFVHVGFVGLQNMFYLFPQNQIDFFRFTYWELSNNGGSDDDILFKAEDRTSLLIAQTQPGCAFLRFAVRHVDNSPIDAATYEGLFTSLNHAGFQVGGEIPAQEVSNITENNTVNKIYARAVFPSSEIACYLCSVDSENVVNSFYLLDQTLRGFLTASKYFFIVAYAKTREGANRFANHETFVSQLPAYNNETILNIQTFPSVTDIPNYLNTIYQQEYPIYESAVQNEIESFAITKYLPNTFQPNEYTQYTAFNTPKINEIYQQFKDFGYVGQFPYEIIINSKTIEKGVRIFREAFNMSNYMNIRNIIDVTLVIPTPTWTHIEHEGVSEGYSMHPKQEGQGGMWETPDLFYPTNFATFKYIGAVAMNYGIYPAYQSLFCTLTIQTYLQTHPLSIQNEASRTMYMQPYAKELKYKIRISTLTEAFNKPKSVLVFFSNSKPRQLHF